MSDFLNAIQKTEPDLFTEKKPDMPVATGVSLQDVKDYVEALKQSLTETMRKEILETIRSEQSSNSNGAETIDKNKNEEAN